jgi:hypothetical protein
VLERKRQAPFILAVVAAGLVLAGCGAGRPRPLALQAKIHTDALSFTGVRGTKGVCVFRTCTITWNERVHDKHEGWLIAQTTIASLDDSYYRPMRRFTLRIRDRHTKRLWSFACSADYLDSSDAHWPYDQCVQTVRPLT